MDRDGRDADLRAWLRGYMEGDSRAGELLAGHVLAAARKRIQGYGVPSNEVDDLAQTCALEVLRHASEFDPSRGRLDAWVGGFAFNAVRQHRRQARFSSSNRQQTEEFAAKARISAPLTLALSHLTQEEKKVIKLRFVDRMSSQEIAGALEKSPEAIRKQISRVLEKLRKHPSVHQLLANA
ncbi:MAG: sigma-70 family RNA polymerase sigma factor [Fimbriimonadales bacterium]